MGWKPLRAESARTWPVALGVALWFQGVGGSSYHFYRACRGLYVDSRSSCRQLWCQRQKRPLVLLPSLLLAGDLDLDNIILIYTMFKGGLRAKPSLPTVPGLTWVAMDSRPWLRPALWSHGSMQILGLETQQAFPGPEVVT